MPSGFVKPFHIENKNAAADARAIWLAVQQPCKAIAAKTAAQPAGLSLHRMQQHARQVSNGAGHVQRITIAALEQADDRWRAVFDPATFIDLDHLNPDADTEVAPEDRSA